MTKPGGYNRIIIEIPLFPSSAEPSAGIKITMEGPPVQMGLPLDTPAPAARPPDAAAEFANAWLSGDLRIPIQPLPSSGLHALYMARCSDLGRSPVDMKNFIRALKDRGASLKTGRFRAGGRLKQARLVWPPGAQRPPGVDLTTWLTDCAREFSEATR